MEEEKKADHPAPSRSNVDTKKSVGEPSVSVVDDRAKNSKESALDSSQPSGAATRKMTPRSSKEQKTIDLLESTIHLQEKRLVEIETKQIPALLRMAKEYLHREPKDRDSALKCAARKRSLERQMDVIKAAIFNMETQMFMLENAMEDRQVHKALEEASQAMKSLQQNAGASETSSVDLTDLAATLLDSEDDDEELMEELQGWISPEGAKKRQAMNTEDDGVSILSMPNVPTSTAAQTSDNETSGMGRLLKAVLG